MSQFPPQYEIRRNKNDNNNNNNIIITFSAVVTGQGADGSDPLHWDLFFNGSHTIITILNAPQYKNHFDFIWFSRI